MERHSLRTFFPLVRFRITVTGNFFNLDSHFARAGRRLRSVLHGGGGPQVSEVTLLGRVTRLSLLQSLIWSPPAYHVNLIKLKWEIILTGGLPTTREQVSKLCTWGCTMYLHNYIWPIFVILAAFVFPFYFYYHYHFSQKEKTVI